MERNDTAERRAFGALPRATVLAVAKAFSLFRDLPPPDIASPWRDGAYRANLNHLEELLSLCVRGSKWVKSQGGDMPQAIDLWVARELRRAGYEADAVWPREQEPRVLPASVARAVTRLSKRDRENPAVARIVAKSGAVSPVVFGEFFPKSVDVLVADWDRGMELMVSTKGMTSSFGKNMNNRWEEFAGDLRNLRGRFPLAVLGIVYLADASIQKAGNNYGRLVDMLLRLRLKAPLNPAYDATTLLLARPDDGKARLVMDDVPTELHPDQFFEGLLRAAFERLPVSERDGARKLYGRGALPTAEEELPEGAPSGPASGS